MEQSISFWGIIKHCRNIIWRGSFVQGRIGRGEFRIWLLLLSMLLSSITLVLWWVARLASHSESLLLYQWVVNIVVIVAGLFVPLVTGIYQVKLVIKRSHDLGRSGWYVYIPLAWTLFSIGALALWWDRQGLFDMIKSGDVAQIQSIILHPIVWIFGILALCFGVWMIVRSVVVGFFRWIDGENDYWANPLDSQKSSSSSYWTVGVVVFILNVIVSFAGGFIQEMLIGDIQGLDTEWFTDAYDNALIDSLSGGTDWELNDKLDSVVFE